MFFLPRPLQWALSLLISTATLLCSLSMLVPSIFLGVAMLAAGVDWVVIALAIGVMLVPVVPAVVFQVMYTAVIRWSRTGEAKKFLRRTQRRLGNGEVSVANWIGCYLNPVLQADVGGHGMTLQLKRSGGQLSPSKVGGGSGFFSWHFDLQCSSKLPVAAAFGSPWHALAARRLGLFVGTDLGGGLWVYTEHPAAVSRLRGRELNTVVKRLLTFDESGGMMLVAGVNGLAARGEVRSDITPEMLATFVSDVARIASVMAREPRDVHVVEQKPTTARAVQVPCDRHFHGRPGLLN